MIRVEEIADKLKRDGRYWIAFTGDSITSCEWVHPNWRDIVVYVLQEELMERFDEWKVPSWGLRGFNFAYDGSTTRDILTKIEDIQLVRPDMVMAVMGGNDPAMKIGVEESMKNTEEIVKKFTEGGARVIWGTSTPAVDDSKLRSYSPYAEALMKTDLGEGVMKVDVFNLYKEYPLERIFTFKTEENPVEGWKEGDPDPEHPNQLGNAYLAKLMLKEGFGIDFDAEKYIRETLAGEKFPGYK